MDDEARRRELLDTHGRVRKTAQALETHAAEVLEMTRRIEELTETARRSGTGALGRG